MIASDVIKKIAFLQCDQLSVPRPCTDCINNVAETIDKAEYITAELIETTAIVIANSTGDYDAKKLTPLELSFAFSFLEDIIPFIVPIFEERYGRDRSK